MKIQTKMGILAAGVVVGLGVLAAGALALSNLGSRAVDEFIAERRDTAPVEQQAAFADGSLTFDEYSQAVDATVACLAAAGYEVIPALEADGRYVWEYTIKQGETAQAFSAVYNECYVTYQRDIDVAWARVLSGLDVIPTQSETSAALAVLEQCMQGRGVVVPADADIVALYYLSPPGEDEPSIFMECVIRTERETGTKLSWS